MTQGALFVTNQILASALVDVFHRESDFAIFERDDFDPNGFAHSQAFVHFLDARLRDLGLLSAQSKKDAKRSQNKSFMYQIHDSPTNE